MSDDLVLELMDQKLHDLMLSYASMRVALETVLEKAPHLQNALFDRMADTVIRMTSVPEEKLLDLMDGSETDDEAHERLDTFIDDLVTPAEMIFSRYLGEEGTAEMVDRILCSVHGELHERVDRNLQEAGEATQN